jgi:hypothetical protein
MKTTQKKDPFLKKLEVAEKAFSYASEFFEDLEEIAVPYFKAFYTNATYRYLKYYFFSDERKVVVFEVKDRDGDVEGDFEVPFEYFSDPTTYLVGALAEKLEKEAEELKKREERARQAKERARQAKERAEELEYEAYLKLKEKFEPERNE